MMKLLISLVAIALTGCSTAGDYYKSVDNTNARNVELARAYSEAEAVRYQALMRIAESGDATAKVAATMALALGGGNRQVQAAVAQPVRSEALEWASILVPGVTQGLSIYHNTRATMNSSDNATRLGINTNATFGQFASEINSPVVVTQPSPVVVTQPSPVVVTQPSPVVVTQPAPVIVQPEVVNPVVVDPVIVQPIGVE